MIYVEEVEDQSQTISKLPSILKKTLQTEIVAESKPTLHFTIPKTKEKALTIKKRTTDF